MRNIKELSVGSFVSFFQPNGTECICEVTEIRKAVIGLQIVDIVRNDVGDSPENDAKIGKEILMPKGLVNRIGITDAFLRNLDFVDSDEKAWKCMYYFGDMRIYYKPDKQGFSVLKFKPDFTQKQWVRISCFYVNQLQNIIRFLTGGELEFQYKTKQE